MGAIREAQGVEMAVRVVATAVLGVATKEREVVKMLERKKRTAGKATPILRT